MTWTKPVMNQEWDCSERGPSWEAFGTFIEPKEHRNTDASVSNLAFSILEKNGSHPSKQPKKNSSIFPCIPRTTPEVVCPELEIALLKSSEKNPLEDFIREMLRKGLSDCEMAQLAVFSVLWARDEFYDVEPLKTFCLLLGKYREECRSLRKNLLVMKPLGRDPEEWINDLQNLLCDIFRFDDEPKINQAMTEICHSCFNLAIIYEVLEEMDCTVLEKKTVVEGIDSLACVFEREKVREEILRARSYTDTT